MIYTEDLLFQEVRPMWAEIVQEVPKKLMRVGNPRVEVKRGMEAYQNAYEAFLPFMILGDENIREEDTLLKNVGTLATNPQVNLKRISDFLQKVLRLEKGDKQLRTAVKVHTTQGAILNDSNWWPFRNDMFMLGAIHSEKEFHLATENGKEPSDDLLWDSKNKRPRVVGRELIMLALAGYQKEAAELLPPAGRPPSHKLKGWVFALPKQNRARELTLSVCRKKFTEIHSATDIRNLFSPASSLKA
jgi:hypothetical protein